MKVLDARVTLAKEGRRKDDASIKLLESPLWHLYFNPFIAGVRDYLNDFHYKNYTTETNHIIARLTFFDEQLLHELHGDSAGRLQQAYLLLLVVNRCSIIND
jgi:hypothetical protein